MDKLMDIEKIPDPLKTVLRFDCNANLFMMDDLFESHRRGDNPSLFEKLREQLNDPELLEYISDPKMFEKLTAMGFESQAGVKQWLRRLHNHLFENGPYPKTDDIE